MKRFTDTCIWNEDWFLEAPTGYKLFWFYIKDNCNHAGIWRVNKRQFEFILGSKLVLNDFLKIVNHEKERIIILNEDKWYLTGFIRFQYGNILNENSRVHNSIIKELTAYNIDISTFEVKLKSNKPQVGVKEGVKDKDKDIIISTVYNLYYDEELKKKLQYFELYEEFVKFLFGKHEKNDKYLDKPLKLSEQVSAEQFIKLIEKKLKYEKELNKKISLTGKLLAMQNKPKLIKDNASLYMTLSDWIERG
jgi:hypothetical protein